MVVNLSRGQNSNYLVLLLLINHPNFVLDCRFCHLYKIKFTLPSQETNLNGYVVGLL